jgi:6-phosphogluconolactonase
LKNIRVNRRQFIAGAAALPFALRALAETHQPKWVLFGTDKGDGIYRAKWNAATGELGGPELAITMERPTYLAMHPRLPVLYAALEANAGDGAIASVRVHAVDATLTDMKRVSAEGGGTCYVSIDKTGDGVFAANYGGGSLAAYALLPDGSFGASAATFDCRNNAACGTLGPRKDRQDAPHLHCATVSPNNRFLLSCNLGEDSIEVFPLHAGRSASELLGAPARVAARAGSGPRHVAFHPNGRWVYCIHELDCTIDLYTWNASTGALALVEGSVVPTSAVVPAPLTATACEVLVSPDGRFVYANTRGEDSITVFAVDAATGMLTQRQRVPSGGSVTRHMTFDPSNRWLVCSHQGSSGISVFARDAKSGALGETPKTFAANTPMFVQFL